MDFAEIGVAEHCRERFVQRILRKERYGHLDRCPKDDCPRCRELQARIHRTTERLSEPIDEMIRTRVARAREERWYLRDEDYVAYSLLKYGRVQILLREGNANFVVAQDRWSGAPFVITCFQADTSRGRKMRTSFERRYNEGQTVMIG